MANINAGPAISAFTNEVPLRGTFDQNSQLLQILGPGQNVAFDPLNIASIASYLNRTIAAKLSDIPVSITDKGAVTGTSDSTASIAAALAQSNTITIPIGDFKTTGVIITQDTTVIFNGGTLSSFNAASRIFTIQNNARLTIVNPSLRGYRLTDDSNRQNHAIVVDTGLLSLIGVGEIRYFAGWGVLFISGGAPGMLSKIGDGIRIHHNGGGVETGNYEYGSIDGTLVYENGFNVARTDWSGISGVGTGWGIHGKNSNFAITNTTCNNNAIGIHISSQGGFNPDHNKVTGNTCNHNVAAGMILENLNSYVTVANNTFLSTVTDATMPNVSFNGSGVSHDYVEINCIGLQVIANDIGGGTSGIIPIYGHGRCRYAFNNLIGATFVENAHPQPGSYLYDFYGYAKNGDNLFIGNMTRAEYTAGLNISILTDSVRTVLDYNIISAGASSPGSGGGKLIDGVKVTPSLLNGWVNVSNSQISWINRKHGNQVTLYIYAQPTTAANNVICNLLAEYRPIANTQCLAAAGNNLTATYATIYPSGDITIVGGVLNQPALINVTYSTT